MATLALCVLEETKDTSSNAETAINWNSSNLRIFHFVRDRRQLIAPKVDVRLHDHALTALLLHRLSSLLELPGSSAALPYHSCYCPEKSEIASTYSTMYYIFSCWPLGKTAAFVGEFLGFLC